MDNTTPKRIYRIRHSEKCFRFKPEAFLNHAPREKGIYELVSFNENMEPHVLFIGAALETSVFDCLEAHANGTLQPSEENLLNSHPNLYFDYLTETGAKTLEDAKDLYWWLIQKYKPPYNQVDTIQSSGRPGEIDVIELE